MSNPDISVIGLPELVRESQLPTTFESNGQLVVHTRSASRRAAQEKWIVKRRLGSGGQAYIDLQERITAGPGTPQLRAVKNLRIPDGHREKSRELYQRELEAIAKFSQAKYSDHFVRSYGWFLSSQCIHIAMEYCELGDLDKYLSNPTNCPDRRLPEPEVHEVSSQILEALDVMHQECFCHRDLKLANILIISSAPSWWVKLADFGLTKRNEDTIPDTTVIRGTPNYMPPELLGYYGDPNKADQYAVDMWCLGQCIFRLFTGIPIFTSPKHLFQYSSGHEEFPELPLRKHNASESLIEYMKKLVAIDPSKRLSSTDALDHPWTTSSHVFNKYSHSELPNVSFSQEETSAESSSAWPDDIQDTVVSPEGNKLNASSPDGLPQASLLREKTLTEASAAWPEDITEFRVSFEEKEPNDVRSSPRRAEQVPSSEWPEIEITSEWDEGETVQSNLSTYGGRQEPKTITTESSLLNTTENAEKFKVAGNMFFKEKDYPKAIDQYNKALEICPSSSTYLGNRAAALMSNEQYGEAKADCVKAIELDPDNRKLILRLVRIYTLTGQPEDAVDTLMRITNPPPTERESMKANRMFRDVKLAFDTIDQDSASSMHIVISALDRAEQYVSPSVARPWKWQVLRALSNLNLHTHEADTQKRDANLKDAEIQVDWLRACQSDHSDSLFLYGRLLYAQGQDAKAIQTMQQAMKSSSYCTSETKCSTCRDGTKWLDIVEKLASLKERGNAAFRAHDWIRARDIYAEALDVDTTNRTTNAKIYQNRARCQMKLGWYDKAIDDCTKAINLDPGYVKAMSTKASATALSGNIQGALIEWKLVKEFSPDDPDALENIRSIEAELADPKRIAMEEAKSKYGVNQFQTIRAMEDLAISLDERARYSEAVNIYEEVLELQIIRFGSKKHHTVLSVMDKLSCALFRAGKYTAASEIFKETFELRKELSGIDNCETIETMSNMAVNLITLGQRQEAEPLLRKALASAKLMFGETDVTTVRCKQHLGLIYFEESRYEEAFFHFRDVLEFRKKFKGEDNLETVGSLHDVGTSLQRLGRYSEALPFLQEATRLRRKRLGVSHEDTKVSMEVLSSVLRNLGLAV